MITNKFDTATRPQIIAAMAEGMRRQGDGCTAEHLKLLGFSQSQIDTHADAARELAMAQAEPLTNIRVPARRAA